MVLTKLNGSQCLELRQSKNAVPLLFYQGKYAETDNIKVHVDHVRVVLTTLKGIHNELHPLESAMFVLYYLGVMRRLISGIIFS